MNELITVINEITKYGLYPNLDVTDKEKMLEKNLVKIYNLYFDIEYEFDETDFSNPNYDESEYLILYHNIRKNIGSNFKDFGYYKGYLNIIDIENSQDHGIGDAVDDLSDIITDLLEIKRRIENNSLADGLDFFEYSFSCHTQTHILNLLKFMKGKNK